MRVHDHKHRNREREQPSLKPISKLRYPPLVADAKSSTLQNEKRKYTGKMPADTGQAGLNWAQSMLRYPLRPGKLIQNIHL